MLPSLSRLTFSRHSTLLIRTKSMLGRLKSQSQSVDVVGSAGPLESALLTGNVSELSNADVSHVSDGDAGPATGEPAPYAKKRWREHVWCK